MNNSEIEQRTEMKFCFKLDKMAIETLGMPAKIYRDAALKNLNMRRSEFEIHSKSFAIRTERTPPVDIVGVAWS
jgi:hypothetical protein